MLNSFRGVSPVVPQQWISFDEAEAVAVSTMSLLLMLSSFRGVSPVVPQQWISLDEAEAVAVGMWRQVVEVRLSSLSYTWADPFCWGGRS